MVKQYKSNIFNWLKTKLNSTASNSKMDGTQSAGSSTLIARADHVHPSDTSKLNSVDAQAEVTRFTNKDRINIERLLQYAEDYEKAALYVADTQGEGFLTHYSLDLKGAKGGYGGGPSGISMGNSFVDYTLSDDKNRLATTNRYTNGGYEGMLLGAMIYKNGEAQPSMTNTITFKFLDGTIIGTNNDVFTNDTVNQGLRNYKAYKKQWKNATDAWSPGIYYVYAEATINGSVIRSNILSVFVKDTNNLLNYNAWSGTEYNDNTQDIIYASANVNYISSNEYSTIGEKSLKITPTSSSGAYARIRYNNSILNKTILFSCNVKTSSEVLRILLFEMGSSSEEIQRNEVSVPANTNNTVSVSLQSTNNNTYFLMQFVSYDSVYIDDISLSS